VNRNRIEPKKKKEKVIKTANQKRKKKRQKTLHLQRLGLYTAHYYKPIGEKQVNVRGLLKRETEWSQKGGRALIS
jgi:hypothetical protein